MDTKIIDKNFVTTLERNVISNIIGSEYMDCTKDEEMIDWGVWSFSATNSRKDLAGALGSLVKKGLCFAEFKPGDNDHVCGLTREGYYWAKNNGLCK